MVRPLLLRRLDASPHRQVVLFLVKFSFALIAVWLIATNTTWRDCAQLQDGTIGYVSGRMSGKILVEVAGGSVISTSVSDVVSIKPGLRSLITELGATEWCMVLLVPTCASTLFWIRWHMLLKWNGAMVDWSWTGGAWIRSQIAGLLPFGSIGADSYRIYSVRSAFPSVATPLGIAAIERLTGLTALIAIGMVGMSMQNDANAAPQVGKLLLFAFAAACLAGAVILGLERGRFRQGLRFTRLRRWVLTVTLPIASMLQTPRRLSCIVGISLLGQSASVLGFVVIDRSMGWNTPLACYFVAIPIVTLAQLLPLHVAGLGVAELGLWFFLSRWTTRSAADAVILANIGRLATWISFAVLGGLFWSARMRRSASRSEDQLAAGGLNSLGSRGVAVVPVSGGLS